MENEQDLVVFTDDDGKELTLEVLDYFFYNGQEYAVLTDVVSEDEVDENEVDEDNNNEACEDCEEGCEHEEEQSLYIMKVVAVGDDQEEFVPVEEELMETLIKIVQERLECDDEDDDGYECCTCGCEDDDDCECEHDHDHDSCGCGHEHNHEHDHQSDSCGCGCEDDEDDCCCCDDEENDED